MKIVFLAVLLWLPVMNCGMDWQLQQKGVCFGAKGSSFGTFEVKKSGIIISIKLVHESGEVNCKTEPDGRSFWGCNGQKLATVVTNTNDKVIFPISAVDNIWFTVPNYTSKSKELIYNTPASRTVVEAGETLRLWYTEDLRHFNDGDNSGKSCAAVYAVITPDLTFELFKIIQDQSKQIQGISAKVDDSQKIIQDQSKQIQGISAKVDDKQKIIQDQSKQIQELNVKTSLGILNECDPDKAVYYPRYTTTHKMAQCYTFQNAPYYLYFIGYGMAGLWRSNKRYVSISLATCFARCEAARKVDRTYNGVLYDWVERCCLCYRYMRGFSQKYKNDRVLYAFSS